MRAAAILCFVLTLSGCASNEGPTTTPLPTDGTTTTDGNSTAGPGSVALFGPGAEMRLCEQMHTFLTTPAAIFDGVLPEGFTLATTNNGLTTDVFVGWQLCEGGMVRGDGQAMPTEFPEGRTYLAALQVIPPTGLATDVALLDLYPLVWLESEVLVTQVLESWKVPYVETGEVLNAASTESDAVTRRTYEAQTERGLFTAENVIQNEATTNDPTAYRVWVATNDAIDGYVRIDNGNGTTVGMGASVLAFNGTPGAAPPAMEGLAHMVLEVTVNYRFISTAPTA